MAELQDPTRSWDKNTVPGTRTRMITLGLRVAATAIRLNVKSEIAV
jgi:hypothetical protein